MMKELEANLSEFLKAGGKKQSRATEPEKSDG